MGSYRLPKAENLQGELPPELLQINSCALLIRSAHHLWQADATSGEDVLNS
jgi:hypothetical protein